MSIADELTRAVEKIVAEVDPREQPRADRACCRDHRVIARRGIEAGLTLAVRLLHEQAGPGSTHPTPSGGCTT
ncbi:MAG: hypothetical protein IT306_10335 [Chloroflexi bacterium]|nr:hypothetical protein [Chloroflexota bacterium]